MGIRLLKGRFLEDQDATVVACNPEITFTFLLGRESAVSESIELL